MLSPHMTATLVSAFWSGVVFAGELPRLQLDVPRLNEKYAGSSNITVFGHVSVPLTATLHARVYHVLDDGGLVPMGGAAFRLPNEGQFAATLFPPSPGWRPGPARIEVYIDGLRQVRAHADFEVLPAAAVQGGDWIIRPPRSSGVVIDRDRGSRQSRSVPAGQRFVVRGTFPLRRMPGAVQGPPLVGELTDSRSVVVQSQSTFSFPDGDDRHWYEIELTAPSTPGTYRLELRPILEEGAKEIEAEAIMLDITEPAS